MAPDVQLTQDRIAQLIALPRGEEPVVSLYLRGWGPHPERRAVLKNLVREGEAQIDADTGWDDARKKEARQRLERAREVADAAIGRMPAQQGRGGVAVFVAGDEAEWIPVPLDVRDRVVVDRSPYASPLSSLIDQYERYAVVLVDSRKAKLFEVYLGLVEGWEELEAEPLGPDDRVAVGGPKQRRSGAPFGAGPRGAPGSVQGGALKAGTGGFHGFGEKRIERHEQMVLHQHLELVADRAFRRFRARPFDRLILAGNPHVLPLFEEHLHSYLKQRVVAREDLLPIDISRDEARRRVLAIEARIEEQKERELLQTVRDNLGRNGLGAVGLDDSLRALFYGQVRILLVQDGLSLPGRECPECHFLFQRPQDELERTPTLVECPLCKRATQRVADIVDEAVELAIMTGARVEHVNYVKDDIAAMGGMAALLRFK